jgi:hypothetical protein
MTATSSEEPQKHDQSRPAADDAAEIVKQLRSAPADEIVAEAFFMLLNAAQIKLGRRDARLLIDLSTVMLEQAGSYLPDTLVKHVEQSLGQLRLGQVSAENELAKRGQPEPNDLTQSPTPPPSRSTASPSAADSQSPTSRLWVPGH